MAVKVTALALASAVFLSNLALAQAPVIDLTQNLENQKAAQDTAVRNNYLELQALREEISSLRGLIEEMNYELRKVKQRQQEDYQDLDQRLSAAGNSASADIAGTSSAPSAPTASSTVPSTPVSENANQTQVDQLYRTGFSALREGNRVEAVRVFTELVDKYPQSTRDADALYWLGETHWLNLDVEKSRQAFTQLIENHPNYRKMSDARYRLGQIYSQLGDQEKALQFLGDPSEDGE